MTVTTYPRRTLKTGRPLGLLDVVSKIADNTIRAIGSAAHEIRSLRRLSDRNRRVAEEAAAVRRLADSHARFSPAFASDLYAAADRHELNR